MDQNTRARSERRTLVVLTNPLVRYFAPVTSACVYTGGVESCTAGARVFAHAAVERRARLRHRCAANSPFTKQHGDCIDAALNSTFAIVPFVDPGPMWLGSSRIKFPLRVEEANAKVAYRRVSESARGKPAHAPPDSPPPRSARVKSAGLC